jgi:hypothetical protein
MHAILKKAFEYINKRKIDVTQKLNNKFKLTNSLDDQEDMKV